MWNKGRPKTQIVRPNLRPKFGIAFFVGIRFIFKFVSKFGRHHVFVQFRFRLGSQFVLRLSIDGSLIVACLGGSESASVVVCCFGGRHGWYVMVVVMHRHRRALAREHCTQETEP